MTLDKNKKYEFAGDVYSWDGYFWRGGDWTWSYVAFQHFADKGLVKEVREPIVLRCRVELGPNSKDGISPLALLLAFSDEESRNRTFDIVATEVVE